MSEEPLSERRRIHTETFIWSLSEDGSTITIIGKGKMDENVNGLEIVIESYQTHFV